MKIVNPKKILSKKQKGVSLLEVLASLQILTIGAFAVTQAMTTQLVMNTLSEQKSAAIFAVQQTLDEIRTETVSILPNSGTTSSVVQVDNKIFAVEVEYCNNSTYCTDSMRHIIVRAIYNGVNRYEVETIYAELQ